MVLHPPSFSDRTNEGQTGSSFCGGRWLGVGTWIEAWTWIANFDSNPLLLEPGHGDLDPLFGGNSIVTKGIRDQLSQHQGRRVLEFWRDRRF